MERKDHCQPEAIENRGSVLFQPVPGSKFTGKMVHRSISSPLAAILINKYSPRKAQAAYLALWLGSGKNSIPIVSDPVNAFNDAWAKEHMKAEPVLKAYTPGRHQSCRNQFPGRCTADLPDRLPRVSGCSARISPRPMSASSRRRTF